MNMIPHVYLIIGLMNYCGVYVESAICQGGPLNDRANNNITCHEQRIQSNSTSESHSVELSLISNDSFLLEPSVVSTASNYLNRTHSEIESSTFLTNVSTVTFDNGKMSNSTVGSEVVPTVMIKPIDSVMLKTNLMLMNSVIDDNSSSTRHTKHMKNIHSPHMHTFRTEKPEVNNYLQMSSSDIKYDQLNINVSEIHTDSSLEVQNILFSSVFDSSLDSSVWTMPISSNISTPINSNQTSFMSSTIDFEQQMNLLSSSISSYDTSSTIFDNNDVNHTHDVVRFSRSMLVSNEMAKQTSGKEKVPSEVTESQLMSSNVSYTSTRTNISTVNTRLLTETNTHPQPTETVQDQSRPDDSPVSLSVIDFIVSSSALIIPTKVALDPNIKTEMVVDFRINELEFGSQMQPISTLTSEFGSQIQPISTLTSEFGSQIQPISTLTSEFGSQMQPISTLTSEFGSQIQPISTLTSEFGSQIQPISTLTSEFGSQIHPISTLTNQLNTVSNHLPSSTQEMLSEKNNITIIATGDILSKVSSEQPYTDKPEPSMRVMPIVTEQPFDNDVLISSGGLNQFKEVLTGMKNISFSDNILTTRIPKVGGSHESSTDLMYVLSNDTITIIVVASVVGIIAVVAAIVIITTFPQTRKRTRKSSTTNDIEMNSKDKDDYNVEKEKENKVTSVPSQTEVIQEKPEIETVQACDETSSDSTPNHASTGDSTSNSALTDDSRSNPESTGDSRPNLEFTGDSNS